MKAFLRLKGVLCSFHNNFKNIRAKALKLFTFGFSLLPLLFCVCLAHAGQREALPAATGVALATDSIKPLQIGDTIPEALWNLPLQMVKAGQEGSTTVTLNDYKGKLIILDFWATWCGACVSGIPKTDSLLRLYKDNLQIVFVTRENFSKVNSLLSRGKLVTQVPFILNDKALHVMFPHRIIPHYIWIDNQGVIKEITGQQEFNTANLNRFINGSSSKQLAFKQDNISWSWLDDYRNAINDTTLLKTSSLRSRNKQIPGGSGFQLDSAGNFVYANFFNETPLQIYYQTLSRCIDDNAKGVNLNPHRIIVELKNKLLIQIFANKDLKEPFFPDKFPYLHYKNLDNFWDENMFNYAITLKKGVSGEEFQELIFNDLNSYFPFEVQIEKRKVRSLVMSCADIEVAKLKMQPLDSVSKYTKSNSWEHTSAKNVEINNLPMDNFVKRMMMFRSPPIIDETGVKGPVHLNIDFSAAKTSELMGMVANIYPFPIEVFTEQLKRYGIMVKEEERMVEVLVISD